MYQLNLSVTIIIIDGIFPALQEGLYKLHNG